MVNSDRCDVRRESFIQPQIGPPFHGYQVTKPLMR